MLAPREGQQVGTSGHLEAGLVGMEGPWGSGVHVGNPEQQNEAG